MSSIQLQRQNMITRAIRMIHTLQSSKRLQRQFTVSLLSFCKHSHSHFMPEGEKV